MTLEILFHKLTRILEKSMLPKINKVIKECYLKNVNYSYFLTERNNIVITLCSYELHHTRTVRWFE